MNLHPLRVQEKRERELAEDKAPDMEALPAEDIKDRDHVREEGRVQALRVARCRFRGDFQNGVLSIYSENNSAL